MMTMTTSMTTTSKRTLGLYMNPILIGSMNSKLMLILIFLIGLSISSFSHAASPIPSSSPRRIPPHNGSMFGKRSMITPIPEWMSTITSGGNNNYDDNSRFMPRTGYQDLPKVGGGDNSDERLNLIFGRAMRRCMRDLQQYGEIDTITMELVCAENLGYQAARKKRDTRRIG